MKFTLEINMNNAAFEDDGNGGFSELLDCLKRAQHQAAMGHTDIKICDSNGNTVGTATITEE